MKHCEYGQTEGDTVRCIKDCGCGPQRESYSISGLIALAIIMGGAIMVGLLIWIGHYLTNA